MERLGMRAAPTSISIFPGFRPDKPDQSMRSTESMARERPYDCADVPLATILPFDGKAPQIHDTAFIAPGAGIIGDVEIGPAGEHLVQLRAARRHQPDRHRRALECPGRQRLPCRRPAAGYRRLPDDHRRGLLIGHMAMVHGCTLEDRAFVGMGAIAMDDCRIGEGAMLAAGALLSPGKAIPPREIWVGRPAKFLRIQDEAQVAKVRFQTERYCRLAERHMAMLSGAAES